METISINESLTGHGGTWGETISRIDVRSLTGGATSSYTRTDAAGTSLFSGGMAPSVDFDFEIRVTVAASTREPGLEQKFRKLADQWRKETGHLSSVTKKAMHPAYQQIIGMGRDAIPLILQELKRTHGHWIWALFSITGEDPAPEGSTFTEAADAWLSWGIQQGYATPD